MLEHNQTRLLTKGGHDHDGQAVTDGSAPGSPTEGIAPSRPRPEIAAARGATYPPLFDDAVEKRKLPAGKTLAVRQPGNVSVCFSAADRIDELPYDPMIRRYLEQPAAA